MKHRLELISFKICPFVQRSVITLKKKRVDFKTTYIDLEEPPQWFHEISPLGQVPVLKVDEDDVIFESAVINEFIDEISDDPMMPADPLVRAKHRAWIQFGGSLLEDQYMLFSETKESDFEEAAAELFQSFDHLESALDDHGPFFSGSRFSLVDSTYAPFFMRLALVESIAKDGRWSSYPKIKAWSKTLLEQDEVKTSVVPEFKKLFQTYFKDKNSFAFKNL